MAAILHRTANNEAAASRTLLPRDRPSIHEWRHQRTTTELAHRPRAPYLLALVLSVGLHVAALLASGPLLFAKNTRFDPPQRFRPVLEVRLLPAPEEKNAEPVMPPMQIAALPAPQVAATKGKDQQSARRTWPSTATLAATAARIEPRPDVAVSRPVVAEPTAVAEGAAAKATQTIADRTQSDRNAAATQADLATASASMPSSTPVAYLDNPKPDYPQAARQDEQEGLVMLRVLVAKDGTPMEIKIGKSSGFRLLDAAAVAGVKRWSFIPAKKNQQNIEAWMDIPIRFRLND